MDRSASVAWFITSTVRAPDGRAPISPNTTSPSALRYHSMWGEPVGEPERADDVGAQLPPCPEKNPSPCSGSANGGSAHSFGFASYSHATGRYEDNILTTYGGH